MSSTRLRDHRAWTKVVAVVALIAAALAMSSCSRYSSDVKATGQFADLINPAITLSDDGGKPLDKDAVGIQPGLPIQVKSTEGALTGVTIDKADGTPIKGEFSDDGATWTSTEPFGFGKTYTVQAEAVGVGGKTTSTQQFTTKEPDNVTNASIMPNEKVTGVATTIGVRFDEAIPDRKKAQDAIKITTDPGVQGAFHWISDSEVRWRPEHFWKPGTKINVAVNIYGIDLGDGLYGADNASYSFEIGRDLEMFADDNTKTVVVKENGKVIKEMPTSMGEPANPTNNGIYIIGDRVPHIIMDSSTYGVPVNSPGGYKTDVDNATQMAYNGIYLHSAPWSLWAQGNTDTSHGCLNLSPDDALWVRENTLRGDPITVTNTVGPELPWDDGLGDWNMPWAQWAKGNA
ncbi:MAG: Ig-like domain-containing protein [Gordonia sp. (in: high G+C Gram-positive bacteria)]|uniref:L,D-transpeptidase n=1 Tax=Gordonia sp. (in: high G+C Gram-positive bacteria) TaxID=84139 RepID=UPI0039E5E10C